MPATSNGWCEAITQMPPARQWSPITRATSSPAALSSPLSGSSSSQIGAPWPISRASPARVYLRHILPNALGPVIVAGTIDVAAAIIAESTLSFLGLGFPPDIPTWGRLLADAKDYLDMAVHWALAPGMAIFLTVLSINILGDWLRDFLDPRLKNIL